MPSVITTVGEGVIAQKQATPGENLEITTLKFFNVDVGGENPTDPNQSDVEPDAEFLVHTASLTASGFINPNAVVYSTLLDSSIGDFTFTWIGWYTAEGALFGITHTTPQYKKQTTGEQTGNNFTRNLIFPFSGAQELTGITVPAATWQLDFTERFERGETEQIKANRALYGRFTALNDAFKITPIVPSVEDDCEAVIGWTLSGGQGTIELDAATKSEGDNSLKISGQAVDAVATKDVSTAPRDWSGKNGLILDLVGDSATSLLFFIEDGTSRRNKWDLVNQDEFTTHELDLDSPDVDNACDYEDVCKFGLEGLDANVIYNIDAIKTTRFNDFVLEAGQAFLEGLRLEEQGSTYQGHLQDYNNIATAVQAIAPPGSGTRKDLIYLDVHLQGEFNTIEPYIQVKVSTVELEDYIGENDYEHVVKKIAEITRTTSEQITASMIADFRQPQPVDDTGVLGLINTTEDLKPHSIVEWAYPFIDGIHGDADDYAALEVVDGVPRDSEGKARYITIREGAKPIPLDTIGVHGGMDEFDLDDLDEIKDQRGPNGETVYSVDGRSNVFAIGDWQPKYGPNGNYIYNPASANAYLEVIGFFDSVRVSSYTNAAAARVLSSQVNGNDQTATTSFQTTVETPFPGNYWDAKSWKDVQFDAPLDLRLNTILFDVRNQYWEAYSIQLGINSDKVTIPNQNCYAQGKRFPIAYNNTLPFKPDVWAPNYGKVGYDGEHDEWLDLWGYGENVKAVVADHDADSDQYSGDPLNVHEWVLNSTESKAYQVKNPFKVSGIHQAENGFTQVNWSTGHDYVALPASGQSVTVGGFYYSMDYSKLYKCIKPGVINYTSKAELEATGLFAHRIPTEGYQTCFEVHGLINQDLGRNFVRATRWAPPAARSIGNADIDERSSGQQRTVFEAGAIDFEGYEAVEISPRQFGNGGENGDSNTAFDNLSTTIRDAAYVRDNALSALVGKSQYYDGSGFALGGAGTGGTPNTILTEFYSGLAVKRKSTASATDTVKFTINNVTVKTGYSRPSIGNGGSEIIGLFSGLPVGTQVFQTLMEDYANTQPFYIDEFILYKLKLPTLPDGAHILNGDGYMGMADAVSPTESGNLVIGKGVRRVHATRDMLYDQSVSGGTDWSETILNPSHIGGINECTWGTVRDAWQELLFTGEDITLRPMNFSNSVTQLIVSIDESVDLSGFQITCGGGYAVNTLSAGTFTITPQTCASGFINISGLTNEQHVVKIKATTGTSAVFYSSNLDLYPGIRRANQKLTYNPNVSPELVGGGDGINNDNLIVSGDGQILEDLRRPDKVEYSECCWLIARSEADTGSVAFDIVRGSSNARNFIVRGVAYIPATGEILILKDGEYFPGVALQFTAVGARADIKVNSNAIEYAYAYAASGESQHATISPKSHHLKRGDKIYINTTASITANQGSNFFHGHMIKGKK